MPEVILLYPWVSHPNTDHLLHGEGRRDAEPSALCCNENRKAFIGTLRKWNDSHSHTRTQKKAGLENPTSTKNKGVNKFFQD